MREQHPSLTARILRRLRHLQGLPGWGRLLQQLVPEGSQGTFLVKNDGICFTGALDSYIERQTYLLGQYEARNIAAFLAAIPTDRRRCILDVGANIGTHALAFAKHFAEVHAFEPNPTAFARLQTNLRLNPTLAVSAHMVGLADTSSDLDFYLTEKRNLGMGTFSTEEQYDVPLIKVGTARVERGDDYLQGGLQHPVDAIKIDVQGFEAEVLLGMGELLARSRPYVWFEVTPPTLAKFRDRAALAHYFPYKVKLSRFGSDRRQPALSEWRHDKFTDGDFLASPVE